jgi:phosphodiesterase/alkaline phosphatase D-like protein
MWSMGDITRRSLLASAAGVPLLGAFEGRWSKSPNRPWLGRDYWANPLQDWRVRDGRIECWVAGGDRNVYLLTHELSAQPGTLRMSVTFGRLDAAAAEGFAGFRFGIHGMFDDYRDSAVHGVGINCGLTADGKLFIGDPALGVAALAPSPDPLTLELRLSPNGRLIISELKLMQGRRTVATVRREDLANALATGGIALVCHSGAIPRTPAQQRAAYNGNDKPGTQRGGAFRCWFNDWTVEGSRVKVYPDQAFGPIAFSMYTLSRGTLKLTAQMLPADSGEPVHLEVEEQPTIRTAASAPGTVVIVDPSAEKKNNKTDTVWRRIASSNVDPMSRTATFKVPNWQDQTNQRYRLTVKDQGQDHSWEGIVKADPKSDPILRVAAMTCNNDFGFPHADMAANLTAHRPDLLVFTGDQIYERIAEYGIQRAPIEQAALDYLRKWYVFGWGYRELFARIPLVTIPDDHDVYHGNLWGAGGIAADLTRGGEARPDKQKAIQDSGYAMPAAWVNAVQRTQTSHLPDPPDAAPVAQGIGVYYCHLVVGGVSFAIVEDRKWKSAPRLAIPWADIQNGWAQNKDYDAAKHGDARGAELLGARQERFLEDWAKDWNGIFLKGVISQTIFANVATLPLPANNDDVTPQLPILPLADYAEGEIPVQDHDSNGWPQTPRNRALRLMRQALAFHIAGDQHLGSTIQYGIDEWGDAAWAICTPAVANIWPRRWYPPKPGRNPYPGFSRNSGEFLDGFGNKVTVRAVSNPGPYGKEPALLHDRAPGDGIVDIDRARRRIKFTNWPRSADLTQPDARPYQGWPIEISQFDNGYRTARFVVGDPLEARGRVVQVAKSDGEVVYTVRAAESGFRARVFQPGTYTIRILTEEGAVESEQTNLASRPI